MVSASCAAAALIVAPAAAARASAQTPRVVLAVSGGVQSSAPALADHFTFESSVETAIVNVTYPTKAWVLEDGSIGVRVWRRIGVGIAVSHTSRRGVAEIDARIPHPLQFEQPRTAAGSQSGINTAQTAAHLQLLYSADVTPRITLVLSAGPSVVRMEQEFVTDVEYSESYPFDEATFTGAGTRRASASGTGFNAGADFRWMFARSVGAGVLVRYSRATLDLQGAEHSVAARAGGVQAGIGLRFAF
jgi:hypothetical protein